MALSVASFAQQYEEQLRKADIDALEKAIAGVFDEHALVEQLMQFINMPRVTEIVHKRWQDWYGKPVDA